MTSDRYKGEFSQYLGADGDRLFGYIHSLVRDLNDADDLYQQAATILWRKFDQFDRQRSFFAWACGVARFEVANFLRARGRKRLYFSDELNLLLIDTHEQLPNDEVEERRQALSECMAKLRERDRQLLEECYEGSTSIVSIAEQRDRSSHSVHNSLRRIRGSLFECIRRTLSTE